MAVWSDTWGMAAVGTVSSLPQRDCLLSLCIAVGHINFLLLVSITQCLLKNNPSSVLPLKEFKPVVKFRGETFSQTACPKQSNVSRKSHQCI